jgi:transposase
MLTDEQWKQIEGLLKDTHEKQDPRGRPRASDRGCFEGIMWVLRTGARWGDVPKPYPSGSTCWRRLGEWEESGVLLEAWRVLLSGLDVEGLIQWEETFMDGSFAPAKKGAKPSVRPRKERERSGWYWSMARVYLWEFSFRVPPRPK